MLADLYHWTPDQIDALDPDYLTEVMARHEAEAQYRDDMERKRRATGKR